MRNSMKKWIQESAGVGLEGLIEESTSLEALEQEMDLGLAQIAVEAHGIEELVDAQVQFEDAIAAMESYHQLLEEATSADGISADSAAFLNVGMEHLAARFGFEDDLPSLEEFGGSDSKAVATTDSKAKVQSRLGRMWEGLVRIVKEMIARVVKFFGSLRDGSLLVKKRAAGLLKKIDEVSKKQGEIKDLPDTIKISGAANLMIGGKWEGYNTAPVDRVAVAVLSQAPKNVTRVMEGTIEHFKKPGSDVFGWLNTQGKKVLVEGFDNAVPSKISAAMTKNGYTVEGCSQELHGGKYLVIAVNAEKGQVKTELMSGDGADVKDFELKLLSLAEAKSLVGKISDGLNAYDRYKSSYKELEKVQQTLIKEGRSVLKNHESVKGTTFKLEKIMSGLVAVVPRFSETASYCLKTYGRMLAVVDQTVRVYAKAAKVDTKVEGGGTELVPA